MLRRALLFPALIFGLVSACSLFGQTSGVVESRVASARPLNRITRAINDQQRVTVTGNHHPLARPEFDRGAAPASHRMERMILTLRPTADQQAALESLIEAQRTPGSAYYHQWITPGRYAELFGATSGDVQQVTNWLASHGMQVEEVTPGGHAIVFSGSATQVESTFHTAIHQYQVGGQLHYANAADPQIPAALSELVTGIVSLHDFHSRPMHARMQLPLAQTGGGTRYLTPADYAVIYNLTPLYSSGLNGAGQDIAIVGRSNVDVNDIRSFRDSFGLAANDPEIFLNGADPGILSGDEEAEADLDIEWAGAVAPGASIKYVVSASTSASDGALLSAEYIVDNNLAPVMSMSFGLCEAALGTTENAFLNNLWQRAAAEGITVIVASGDSGAAGCDAADATTATSGLAVNGLASTPYNIAVGGTMFQDSANPSLYWSTSTSLTQASALRYIPEAAWNESASGGLWASGGGASTIYPKPSWQSAMNVPADGYRDVPDVSLTAAGHDGYPIFTNGGMALVGGTSAAAPAFAGIMSLVVQNANARQGNANPVLYTLATRQETATGATVFHDVTAGNNSVPGLAGYSAQTGYDLATGLGSVDAAQLVQHWGDPAVTKPQLVLGLSTSAVAISTSSNGKLSATVSVSGGFSAPVLLSTSGLPAGFYVSFTPTRLAAPGNGSSTVQVFTTSAAAIGTYNLTITASGGGLSQSAALTVTVSAPPAYALTLSPSSLTIIGGHKAVITITGTAGPGFNQAVGLSMGLFPAGTAAVLWPKIIPAPGTGTTTLSIFVPVTSASGTYTIPIKASTRQMSTTAMLTITVNSAPTFLLNTASNLIEALPGYNASVPITISGQNGFNSAVNLAIGGLPAGVTASLSPAIIAAPGTGTSTLMFTAAATTAPGSYSVTLQAMGGGITQRFPLILMIDNPATAAPPPVLFYSDIDSGPATGGEGGTDGAFFCVYGENFGATQGTSTMQVGGVDVSSYKVWSDPGAPYTPGYYAKACGQISHLTASGPQGLQLTTVNGSSNTLPFTVRSGIIYWVSTAGNDKTGTGSQTKPWATITKCKGKLGVGDICLIGDGVVLNTINSYNIALQLDSSGTDVTPALCGTGYSTACGPKTIMAYPGANVSVDVHKTLEGRPLETYRPDGAAVTYWTIAGMTFNGNSFGVQFMGGNHFRFVDNEVMCEGGLCNGSWYGGGLVTNWANNLWVYGNRFHDIGCHEDPDYTTSTHYCASQKSTVALSSSGTTLTMASLPTSSGSAYGSFVAGDVVTVNGQSRRTLKGSQTRSGSAYQFTLDRPFDTDLTSSTVTTWTWRDHSPSKMYHSVYFSTNGNHVWFGWNSVHGNGMGCRGVLFNSASGSSQYDLHVHDNVIHDTVCDGIAFATVNPSLGTVEIYNNVLYNTGSGPDPIDGPSYYSCILDNGGGTGPMQVFNNTFYNCGNNPTAYYPQDRGGVSTKSKGVVLTLIDNILVQSPGIPYAASSSVSTTLTGTANLFYGNGAAPKTLSAGAISNLDPLFVNVSARDFHLRPNSPAINSGVAVSTSHVDQDGFTEGTRLTLGAYAAVEY